MKIRSVVLVVVLWLFGAIPVSAENPSHRQPDDHSSSAATVPALEEKIPDSKAVAEFESALKLENKLEQELQAVYNIEDDILYINDAAARLSNSLKAADTAAQNRNEVFSRLPQKANTALERRKDALAAVNAYRAAANEALRAIAAYAGARKKSAEAKARLADAALNKKAAFGRQAAGAVSVAADARKSFDAVSANVLVYDNDVKRYLSAAHGLGEEITSRCDSLAEKIKDKEPGLTAVVNQWIPKVRTRAESMVKHISEARSRDIEAYRQLIDGLKEMRVKYEKEHAAVESYFETSVQTVVKSEAYAFMNALHGKGKIGKHHKNELKASAASLKITTAEAEKLQMEIKASSEDSPSFLLNALSKNTGQYPKGFESMANLINESSTLSSGFDVVEVKIKAAVSDKQEKYKSALIAAEEAHFRAYGDYRSKFCASLAEPPPSPAPSMAPNIDVVDHVYSHVYALGGEPRHYGAYTYVLFVQDFHSAQNHIKQRYEALLFSIYRSTSSMQKFSAKIPKERLNLFCIPFTKKIKDKTKYEEYDSDLARSYLVTAGSGAILRKDILDRIRMSPGPFLLTTRSPLSEGGSKNQMLFVDLSRYSAAAFDSILAAYKYTIIEHPPAGQEIWIPPATQRVVYAAISATTAIPVLADKLKKIVDFFVPSAEAGTGGK